MAQCLQFIHLRLIHMSQSNLILLCIQFDGTFLPLMKQTHISLLLLLNQPHFDILLPLFDDLGFQVKSSSVHLCFIVLPLIEIIRPFLKIHVSTSLLQSKCLSLTFMCQYRSSHLHFLSKFQSVKLRLLPIIAYVFANGSIVLKFAIIESSTAFQFSILLFEYIQSLEKMSSILLVFYESCHSLSQRLGILILPYFSLVLNLEVTVVSTL